MTQSELAQLVALKGQCSYHDENKQEYKRLSLKLLRTLRRELGLDQAAADIRNNPGGIAVSGDSTLHADHVYVTFNMDGLGLGVLVRTCKHRKDYTGGPNRWFSFERLRSTGIPGIVAFVLQVLEEGRWTKEARDGTVADDPGSDSEPPNTHTP